MKHFNVIICIIYLALFTLTGYLFYLDHPGYGIAVFILGLLAIDNTNGK